VQPTFDEIKGTTITVKCKINKRFFILYFVKMRKIHTFAKHYLNKRTDNTKKYGAIHIEKI